MHAAESEKSFSLARTAPSAEASHADSVTTTVATAAGATNHQADAAVLDTSRQPSLQSRHSTSTRASRLHQPCKGKHFAKGADVSCANYFFYKEDVVSFGVGTVGLYAAKTTPAAAATTTTGPATGVAAAPSNIWKDTTTALAGAQVSRADREERGDTAAARRYQAPADRDNFLVPRRSAAIWEAREADYRQWKRQHLACSSFGRLSQRVDAGRNSNGAADVHHRTDKQHHNQRDSGSNGRFALTVPGPGTYLNLPELWSREERMRLEQRRLRALEAERAAKAAAQLQSNKDHEQRVLQRRSRKLKGEALDLPDAYLRATYPDPIAPNKGNTRGASSQEDADEVDPQRVVKDHVRARQLHLVDLQNRHVIEEIRRQGEAEKQRQAIAKQLEERRNEEAEFRAAWMEGRPRISRSRETRRHDAAEAEKRAAAQLNHSMQAQMRELYAHYAMADSTETTARQQELRKWVLTRVRSRRGQGADATTTTSRSSSRNKKDDEQGGVPTSGRLGSKPTSRAASPPTTVAARAAASPSQRLTPTPPLPTTAAAPARSEEDHHADARPVTPSQLVGPTSTNFFNEVKQWMQSFPSPNAVPPNAAEAAHRRAWKAGLDEAQLQFNRESTQRQRSDYPRRIIEAREKTQEAHWMQAEDERHEKKTFATRRADHAQADLLAATAMRVSVQSDEQRAQLQRQARAAEKHNEVQQQRLQSKHREEVMRRLEAEEQEQLRLVVSAHGARA
jgi:hypothetical protein